MSRLHSLDLSLRLTKEESDERVAVAQRRLMQLRLFSAGLLGPVENAPGLLVLFEGFDGAGKGGAIRRLTSGLDPRLVRVVPIAAPTPQELSHHFLWRFQSSLPGRGDMTVYDRSWYGRLLVERVEHLIDTPTVRRSSEEIVHFEESLTNDGVTVVKFFLYVSADEQLRRFNDRASDPLKQWKLTDEDWRNRSLRDAYKEAVEDMFATTDHPHAHWDVVVGEDKHYARVQVLETLIQRWEADFTRRGLRPPTPVPGNYLN